MLGIIFQEFVRNFHFSFHFFIRFFVSLVQSTENGVHPVQEFDREELSGRPEVRGPQPLVLALQVRAHVPERLRRRAAPPGQAGRGQGLQAARSDGGGGGRDQRHGLGHKDGVD